MFASVLILVAVLSLTMLSSLPLLTKADSNIAARAAAAANIAQYRSGKEAYSAGVTQLKAKNYDVAADALFVALIARGGVPGVSAQEIMQLFWKCYSERNILEKGYVYIGKKYLMQGDTKSAIQNAEQSLQITPNPEAHILLAQCYSPKADAMARFKHTHKAIELAKEAENIEALMDASNIFYEDHFLNKALETLEEVLAIQPNHFNARANSIYMRANTFSWKNITFYQQNMKRLEDIVAEERRTTMLKEDSLEQQSAIHPHMTLGYDIDPVAKLKIARSHAQAEKVLVTNAKLQIVDHLQFLDRYRDESLREGFRIKIGYVSANFKTKATIYLAQDMFQFHDQSKFEVHVYATTGNDNPHYLKQAMRDVDWRQKIQDNVEFFHDMSGKDVSVISKQILEDGIHILFNWDGYSNNGVRATGLFPIQSAPIQVVHLEYVGTMGADYIQYVITDKIASPMEHEAYYSEKFMYMPQFFFCNSFPYQRPHMFDPVYDTDWSVTKEIFLKSHSINIDDVDFFDMSSSSKPFIYCQFNKHLKISPVVFTEWLKVLQGTENSILLLLENPHESIANFEAFIKNFDPSLENRVLFATFLNNPYDNQFRVSRVCNVVLDNPTYNSHTTAVDALWGGTPIVTLGNDRHMAGRVVESILTALGLPELISYSYKEFVEIAIRLCKKRDFYLAIRKRLVDENMKTVKNLTLAEKYAEEDDEDDEDNVDVDSIARDKLKANREYVMPNQYWDLKKYVHDMETGLSKMWEYYLETGSTKHIAVNEEDEALFTTSSPNVNRTTADSIDSDSNDVNSEATRSSGSGSSGRSRNRCGTQFRERPAFAAKYYYKLK